MDLLGLPKDREELAQEPILKQGMVLKRGRKVTSQWKKRYFVLRPTTLSYHAGIDTEKEERRYIEITQNSTVIHRPDKHPLAFQVRTPGYRKITGKCENEEDLQLWMSAIEECIQRAPAWPIKCVVVGDDDEPTFGKRTLVSRYLEACRGKMEDGEAKMTNSHGYTLNKSRTRIVKTPDELGNVDIMLEYEKGEWVKVMLWHLDGREECTKLRALAYPHSDIYIVVFSVSVAKSFEKVDNYLKEIKSTIRTTAVQSAQAPLFLLVGTRFSSQLVEVGFNQAEEKARSLGFAGYVECRIESHEDCAQMFFDAVRLVVEKTVVVYAPNDPHNAEHARHSSGMFSSLAARLRKKNLGEGQHEEGKTLHSTADTDSPDNSPSHKKKGFGFFSSSDKVLGSALRTNSSKKSDMTSQSESVKSTATNNRPSAAEMDDDSDEGSLIGVEVDETDEDAKARHDRDFGLSSMKDDPQYTQRVLSRSSSRRSGEQSFVSHRSLGTHPDKELYDIHETPAEERERELEELREKDAKKEREIERMKVMMDSLKTHNLAVEEQLKAMREELARVNLRGGPTLGVAPPTMSGLLLPPSSVPLPNREMNATALPELPPRVPGPLDRSPASKASFRANRATSVFF